MITNIKKYHIHRIAVCMWERERHTQCPFTYIKWARRKLKI